MDVIHELAVRQNVSLSIEHVNALSGFEPWSMLHTWEQDRSLTHVSRGSVRLEQIHRSSQLEFLRRDHISGHIPLATRWAMVRHKSQGLRPKRVQGKVLTNALLASAEPPSMVEGLLRRGTFAPPCGGA
ncbi:hypothetical protein DACRYDRAFT_106569 [Dacryopinax primogenitus]|uniref:Uncharacterized protein n=1 Tax=Dacryopinax primogenitus (strain DJM 731) TaxID=1858805 RepID=M5GEN1_DACPD|nr:uncharacterized protein DACRYDRAFT_106569 [Dacryopinax primogenitus]EJU03413.1 hypothetical protein DACRYDRAFT_106569 [Dacryopinax primogenitus]